jgi:dephospho-CoA kinase
MAHDRSLVIGVAGRIGSGKSEAAHFLERECSFHYVRYSAVLADWFGVDPAAKERLQDIGENVMSSDDQLELNRRVLQCMILDRDNVVDGLRHPTDYETLQRRFGSSFFFIFIDTPADIRFERLRDRFGTYEEFLAADSRWVESHILALQPLANLVLSGSVSERELTSSVELAVRSFRKGERS